MANSVEFRKEAQKNTSQMSCSSAPLPSSSLTGSQCLTPAPLRPRSLYTTHTYHAQAEQVNFQVCLSLMLLFNVLFQIFFSEIQRIYEVF